MKQITRNTLFYGDNLKVLREYIPDESVDLIYLDPPFNSNRSYNVLFKDERGKSSDAQIKAFDDTWHWGEETEIVLNEMIHSNRAPEVTSMLDAMIQFMGCNQMTAYLVMMAARLVELRRVLKPTGSLYLHCDPTASHYLKILLDTIFGFNSYRNEIIWKRTNAHNDAQKFSQVSDTILYYVKTNNYIWNKQRTGYSEEYLQSHYSQYDNEGRRFRYDNLSKPKGSIGYFYELLGCQPPQNGWRMPEKKATEWLASGRIEIPIKGNIPSYKRYLDEMAGVTLGNIWDDINPLNSQAAEALGYPTQKPVALLKRILEASSNEGDTILDPFSGCGTAIAAAEELHRRWIGIDITHLAIAMHKVRLAGNFHLEPKRDYDVVGEPADLADAHKLASEDRYQFQWWALSLLKARPLGGDGGREGKKGSDKGIDGVITFKEDAHEVGRIIIQVKSGKVNSSYIRDLKGTLDREKAEMALFVTLEQPTADMIHEANQAGLYQLKRLDFSFPRVQIVTIDALLSGEKLNLPILREDPLPQAQKVKRKGPKNPALPGLEESPI